MSLHVSGSAVGIFDNFKNFAYGGIAVVFGVCIALNDFPKMWVQPSRPADTPLFIAKIVLFIELAILTYRWIVATHFEFHLWEHWLDNPFEGQHVYGAIVSLSILLGLSLAFPHHIVFITALFSLTALLTYWTGWLCVDHFDRALQSTRRRATEPLKEHVLAAMESYWLRRPHLGRMVVIMFMACIAFSLAFAGIFADQQTKQMLDLSAYVIIVMTILIAEVVIAVWRHTRDREIDRALSESAA